MFTCHKCQTQGLTHTTLVDGRPTCSYCVPKPPLQSIQNDFVPNYSFILGTIQNQLNEIKQSLKALEEKLIGKE